MNKLDAAMGIRALCELMQQTDCSEICMEVGLNGAANDGARFLFHIIRQCPELAVEQEDDDESDEEDEE